MSMAHRRTYVSLSLLPSSIRTFPDSITSLTVLFIHSERNMSLKPSLIISSPGTNSSRHSSADISPLLLAFHITRWEYSLECKG